jgi:hypothetical protein
MTAAVDWGQDGKDFLLKDEAGEKMVFYRYVEMLNRMGEWGYEYVGLIDNEINPKVQNWLFINRPIAKD